MTQHRVLTLSRGRHGFTLIELLVVIAIISIIAGFLVPTLLKGRGEAYKVQCTNNLRQIYTLALNYSNKKGNQAFPIGEGKEPPSHESLNKLVAYEEGLSPKLFNCPQGLNTPAEVDKEKKTFVLDEGTLDYSWVKKRTKNTATNRAISSDKYIEGFEDGGEARDGHTKGMNVLMSDGSVTFMDDTDLPEDKLPEGLTR